MSEQNGFPKDSYEGLAHQQQQITTLSHSLKQVIVQVKEQQQSNPAPQMRAIAEKLERLDQTIEEMQKEWKQRDPREKLSDLSKKHDILSSAFERVEERLEEQERTLSIYLGWKYLAFNVGMISFLAALFSVLGMQWTIAHPIEQQLNAVRQENAALSDHLRRIEKRLGVPKR